MGRSLNVDIIRDQQVADFEAQIKALADKYGVTGDDSDIISSPLQRCVTTATIIKDILHKNEPITVWDDLNETDMGSFEGQTGEQLRENVPGLLDQWKFSPESFQFPDGESYVQVSARVDRIMDRLLNMEPKKSFFVCTHVDIAKLILLKIQGKGFNERRGIDVPNGNIAILAMDQKQKKFTIVDSNWKADLT